MRILHVVPRYYPARGGAETHMAEFSQRLAADGHAVTVVTTDADSIDALWDARQPRLTQRHETIAGVQVVRFPLEHLPFSSLSFAAVRRLLWVLSRLSAPVPLLLRLARVTPRVPALWRWLATTEAQFDVVGGMGIAFESLLAAGLQFAQAHDLPFIAFPLTHLGAGPQPGRDSLSAFYTLKHQVAVVRASTVAIMQTPSERSFYEGHGIPPSRLPVVGPGVTPTAVLGGRAETIHERYDLEGPVIFSLGAMSFDKGTFHVVDAVQNLWEQGIEAELFIAGAMLEGFRQHLTTLPPGVRERIHVLEAIDEQEKRDLFAACDVFVLPSRTDSFGIVYLEAWLYRKPVIAAETWGVRDVVEHGGNGLLVPFGDVTALAGAIASLLADPARAEAYGTAGEKKVYGKHTWAVKYDRVRQIYAEVVG